VVINDGWTYDFVQPAYDDACSNWIGLNGTQNSTFTMFEVKRQLFTGDTQDRQIVSGPNKVIYSHSIDNSDTLAYHGPNNRGSRAIVFFGVDNDILPTGPNISTLVLSMPNFALPSTTTNYVCKSFVLPSDQDYHVIAFEPVINASNVNFVHHMLVHSCLNSSKTGYNPAVQTFAKVQGCTSPLGNTNIGCTSLLFGWAIGASYFVVPEEAGFRIGASANATKFVVLEIHYNNPADVSNVVDNSGVRFHYTTDLRPNDAGVMVLGDPAVSSVPIAAGQSYVPYEMSCTSTCTDYFPYPLQVFGSFLHMHDAGKMIWSTQWHNNAYVGTTNRIEFWYFAYQETTIVNYTIYPGDRLNLHCVYDTNTRNSLTTFGISTMQEMCMEFLSYYPKVTGAEFCGYVHYDVANYTYCGNNIIFEQNPVADNISSNDQRSFGTQNLPTCQSSLPNSTSSISFTTVFAIYMSITFKIFHYFFTKL